MSLSSTGWNEMLRQNASGAPIGSGTVIKSVPVAPRPPLPKHPPTYNPYPSYGPAPRSTSPTGPRASEFYGQSGGKPLPPVTRGPTYAPPGTPRPLTLPRLPTPSSAMAQIQQQAAAIGIGTNPSAPGGLPTGTAKPTGAGPTAGPSFAQGLAGGIAGGIATSIATPLVEKAAGLAGDLLIDAFGGDFSSDAHQDEFCSRYPNSKHCQGWTPPVPGEAIAGGAVAGQPSPYSTEGLPSDTVATLPLNTGYQNGVSYYGEVPSSSGNFAHRWGPISGPIVAVYAVTKNWPGSYNTFIRAQNAAGVVALTRFTGTGSESNFHDEEYGPFLAGLAPKRLDGQLEDPFEPVPSKEPAYSPTIASPPPARVGEVPPMPAAPNPDENLPGIAPIPPGDPTPSLSPEPDPSVEQKPAIDPAAPLPDPLPVATPENTPSPGTGGGAGKNAPPKLAPPGEQTQQDDEQQSGSNPLGGLPFPPLIMPALPTGGNQVVDPSNPDPTQQTKPKPTPSTEPQPQTKPQSGCGCNAPILSAQAVTNQKIDTTNQKLDALEAALGVGSNVGNAAIMAKLEAMDSFAQTAWRATHLDKVWNLLTLIGVLHNVSMLSRDIGETLGYALSNALAAVGIEDSEGNPLDVNAIVGGSMESFIISILGQDVYNDLRSSYQKANRIVQTASNVIWTVRSIQDASLDLLEWVGEHTGKIGNALKRFGIVGERAYPWMSERPTSQERWRRKFDRVYQGLETAEDAASSFAMATGSVLEITQETGELFEAKDAFSAAVADAIPQQRPDNTPVAQAATTEATNSQSPEVSINDTDRGG